MAGVAGVAIALAATGCAARREGAQTTVNLEAGGSIAPRITRYAKVQIPAELRDRHCTTSSTLVEVRVGATGMVEGTAITRGSGEPAFDQACVRSAHQPEYAAGSRHGTAASGVTHLECRLECR
jgi:outer membrane biosynthesis protein TonB